jgi:four helix bundle protein
MKDSNSILYNKSYIFALEVVEVYKTSFKYQISDIFRQFLKSGTSVGANMAEANGALTEADFSSKVSIAYKEILETRYWLSLMKDIGCISIEVYNSLDYKAEEMCKIAFTILKTTGRIHYKNKI